MALKALKVLTADAESGVVPVLVGPRTVWRAAADLVGLDELPGELHDPFGAVRPDWRWGEPTVQSGCVAAESVEVAARLCLDGNCDALVTAPLTKGGLAAAKRPFPGHTELLESLCRARGFDVRATMMLAGDRLRVFLVTTHAPLAEVPRLVTRESVLRTLTAAHGALEGDLAISSPRLAVAGLNPHAGEGGVLGSEEQSAIAPAVSDARHKGIDAVGPLAADTLFVRAYQGEFDAVVAMYHDQGLPALKLAHFWDGVNVTFGLPLVRTSPDHGTAFELAGKATAREDSFQAAVRAAVTLALRRRSRASFQGVAS